MAESLLGPLADLQFYKDMLRGLTDAGNRGFVGGLLGAPVDMATGVINAGLMGGGALGQKMGLLSAAQMPDPIERPVGGSEWIGQKMQDAGMVSDQRNAPAEMLAGLLGPGAMSKAGKAAWAMEQNAAAPTPMNAASRGQAGAVSIGDWKWRPEDAVRQEVGLTEVPDYIQSGYGQFMKQQAARAAAAELSQRDLIKAYGITRSSVNRAGREMSDDLAKGFTRPEGYMSEWFSSPTGKAYLDGAVKGEVNKSAIEDITQRFKPFGMSNTLGADLEYAAQTLSKVEPSALNASVTGPKQQWREFSQNINGIGPSKSGFIASLLGRGDIPTLDARQLNLHTDEGAKGASKYIRRQGGAGGNEAVDRLASRQDRMAMRIDPELRPFYQHLTHHAVWDKIGNSITTHSDIVKAMRTAGVAAFAIPQLVDIVMREKGLD